MSIAEYEEQISLYGDIISSTETEVGYEIRLTNKTGNLTIFEKLYIDYLAEEFALTGECEEPSYYKAYFLKIPL